MPITIGQHLGSYEITALLGKGGMGEVYRAQDTKLNRPVAIKFLSGDVGDVGARHRFQREAQMASSLNHPHIVTVYDVGEFEGRQYIVTEFVDGGTLKDWLRERRTWKQVVELLTGVADGLAAAHSAMILHRDIKPANVLVAKNGYAKLADFGLAKLDERETTDATATLSDGRTRPGVVLGTIAYMSPEQAAGKGLDARSDIFSFGVLLYEALSGKRPFGGVSELEVLKAIIERDPEPLGDNIPPALRALVEKALGKDPAERYQSMREVVVDLRRAARAKAAEVKPAPQEKPRVAWWAAAVVTAALLAGIAVGRWMLGNQASGWRNPLEGATFTRLTDFEGAEEDAIISPDGNFVTFLSDRDGHRDVWVLQIASGQFLNLTQGKFPVFDTQIRVLGFSPDSSQVSMVTGRAGYLNTAIVPVIDGTLPRVFLEGGLDVQWSPDGKRLLFFSLIQNKDVMFIADSNGANPRQVFEAAPGEHNHFMGWSPDGRYAYSVRSTRNIWETDVWRAPAAGGRPERVTHHNAYVAYAAPLDDRTLLYLAPDEHGAGSWLYAMDLEHREEHRLSAGIEQYSSISVSEPAPGRPRRLVATVSNPVGSLWTIPITDSVAPESAASTFPVPSAQVSFPRFGPDYVLYLSAREIADSLWKLQGSTATELWKATEGAVLAAPAISSDGKRIAIAALKQGHAGLQVMTSDGANPQPLAPSLDVRGASSWSPDGRTIAVTGFDEKGPGLFLVPVDGGAPARIYDKLCYHALWAPDGKYILFAEYFQGTLMHVKAIAPEGEPVPLPDIQLSQVQTARSPVPYRFLRDGKSIVLEDGGWRSQQFYLVSLETGRRRQLTDLKTGASIRSFDVSQDGKQILFDRVQQNSDVVLIELPK